MPIGLSGAAAWAQYRPQTLEPAAASASSAAPDLDAAAAARLQGLTALQAALNDKQWEVATFEVGLSGTSSDVRVVGRIVVVLVIAHSAVADEPQQQDEK